MKGGLVVFKRCLHANLIAAVPGLRHRAHRALLGAIKILPKVNRAYNMHTICEKLIIHQENTVKMLRRYRKNTRIIVKILNNILKIPKTDKIKVLQQNIK